MKAWKDFCGAQNLWCDSDYSWWYFKCLFTGKGMLQVFFKKGSFICLGCVFFLSHLLVIKSYELSKDTSHFLSVPLALECIRILYWCIFFYFGCLPHEVLCNIVIWADDTALDSSCEKPSNLLQQVEIVYVL